MARRYQPYCSSAAAATCAAAGTTAAYIPSMYKYVTDEVRNWEDSNAQCLTDGGSTAHLVTIEASDLFSLLTPNNHFTSEN